MTSPGLLTRGLGGSKNAVIGGCSSRSAWIAIAKAGSAWFSLVQPCFLRCEVFFEAVLRAGLVWRDLTGGAVGVARRPLECDLEIYGVLAVLQGPGSRSVISQASGALKH